MNKIDFPNGIKYDLQITCNKKKRKMKSVELLQCQSKWENLRKQSVIMNTVGWISIISNGHTHSNRLFFWFCCFVFVLVDDRTTQCHSPINSWTNIDKTRRIARHSFLSHLMLNVHIVHHLIVCTHKNTAKFWSKTQYIYTEMGMTNGMWRSVHNTLHSTHHYYHSLFTSVAFIRTFSVITNRQPPGNDNSRYFDWSGKRKAKHSKEVKINYCWRLTVSCQHSRIYVERYIYSFWRFIFALWTLYTIKLKEGHEQDHSLRWYTSWCDGRQQSHQVLFTIDPIQRIAENKRYIVLTMLGINFSKGFLSVIFRIKFRAWSIWPSVLSVWWFALKYMSFSLWNLDNDTLGGHLGTGHNVRRAKKWKNTIRKNRNILALRVNVITAYSTQSQVNNLIMKLL